MRITLSILACLFFMHVVFAQPANDDCAQATELSVSTTGLPVFTESATQSATPSMAGCTGTATADVWFSFTALQSTQYIYLQHNISGPTNSVIQVFSGSCGAATSLSCNTGLISSQNFPNTSVMAQTGLVAGQTYLIRVYYNNTTTAAFSIGVANRTPNDECADAVSLTVSPDANSVFIPGTTFGATANTPNNDCIFSTSNDVWYSFTASASVHAIDVLQLNSPRIQIFTGSCGSLSAIPCNFFYQTIGDTNRATVSGLTPGITYLVKVFSANFNTNNRFQIAVQTPYVAPNDVCANATVLPISGNSCTPQRISFRGAVPDGISHPSCTWTGSNQDIWYAITPSSNRFKVKFTQADGITNWVKRMALYSGTCNNLTPVVCAVSDSFSVSGLVPGTIYYLRVAKGGGNLRDSIGELCAYVPDAVPYDECSNAAILQVDNSYQMSFHGFTTRDASYSSVISPLIDPIGTGSKNDIFLKFTAIADTTYIGFAPGTTNVDYTIFTGGCNSPIVVRSTTTVQIDAKSMLLTTSGEDYFIRLSSAAQGFIQVGLSTSIDAPNKLCVNALPVAVGANAEKALPNKVQFGTIGLSRPSCLPGYNREVWFSFQAPTDSLGMMLAAPAFTYGYEIFTGTCEAPVSVRCANITAGTTWAPTVVNGLVPGTQYLFRLLWNSFTAESRQPLLYLFNAKKSGNNYCTQAVSLAVQPPVGYMLTAGSTAGNYNEVNNCTTTGEAWYAFTATANTHTMVIKGNLSPRVSLYTGQCGSLSLVSGTCLLGQPGRDVRSLVNLTPGTTYFIRVAGSGNFSSSGPFEIAVIQNITPANDECANPVMLPIQQLPDEKANLYYTTISSTASTPGTVPSSACFNATGGDVWFGFTGNGKQLSIETDVLNSGFGVFVYSGSCGNFTEIACGENAGILSLASQNGIAYRVRVTLGRTSSIALALRMRVFETPDLLVNELVQTSCLGTNLVLNPGFDTLKQSTCPTNFVTQPRPDLGPPRFDLLAAQNWSMPTYATTDIFSTCGGVNAVVAPIFNVCNGSQTPRSGNGFAGIYAHIVGANYQEYLQGTLREALVPSKTYLFSFNVSLADFSPMGIDRFGVYFSSSPVAEPIYGSITVKPQLETPTGRFFTEKNGWITISFLYTPTEAVQYFVLGNFRHFTETNTVAALENGGRNAGGVFSGCATQDLKPTLYYFIDDVTLAEVNGSDCLLPINDLAWDAIGRQGQGIITWSKKDESDVTSYSIEHSFNGSSFNVVFRQQASSLSAYRFVDHKLTAGKHFYRIRVHYKDGQTEVTGIKTIEIGSASRIQVYPTLTKGNVLIRGIATPSQVQVMMPQGSVLQRLVMNGDGSIDLGRYPAGLYIITITNKNKEQVHFRVIKE